MTAADFAWGRAGTICRPEQVFQEDCARREDTGFSADEDGKMTSGKSRAGIDNSGRFLYI